MFDSDRVWRRDGRIVFARCLQAKSVLRLYSWVKSTMPVTDGYLGFEVASDKALAEFANINNALRKLVAIWEFERENVGRGIRRIVVDARGGLGANVADTSANGIDPELDPPRA
jgi:hypothetical protein